MSAVLDSWAVLRFLEDADPAAAVVADAIGGSAPLMSWIDLGEVHDVLRRLHGEDAAATTVRDLREVLDLRLPDERLVLDAARLKADHQMAYADAFAAALARAEDVELWTGDPELLVEGAPWRWRDLRQAAPGR